MIRWPALVAHMLLDSPKPAPRPDTGPDDPWRDLPPLPDPLPFMIVDDPPPRDLRERDDLPPLWTPPAPPNRAQRRAAEREERRQKKRGRLGLWWGIDHAVGRR